MRFRSLLWWPYLLLFLAIIGPWYIWIEIHFDGAFHRFVAEEWTKHLIGRYPNGTWYDDVPRWQFAASHLAWWFPWSVAILPALIFSWRRVDAAAGDQFPGCATDGLGSGGPGSGAGDRAAAGLLRSEHVQRFFPVGGNDFRARFKFSPQRRRRNHCPYRNDHRCYRCGASTYSPCERTRLGRNRFSLTAWKALADMPASVWLQFRPLLAIAAIALLLGAIATVYLLRRGREKIAVVGLACGLIVFGLCMVSGIARIAPFFSWLMLRGF